MMVIVVDSFVLFPPFGSTILKPDLLGRNGRIETLRGRNQEREREKEDCGKKEGNPYLDTSLS